MGQREELAVHEFSVLSCMVTTKPSKNITKGNKRELAIIWSHWCHKNEKNMFGLIYLSTHSCDAMYRVQESKSKLELFYRLFTKLFLSQFLALGLKIFNVFHLPPTLFLSLPSLLQRMGRDPGITLWYGITILGKNKKRFGF